MIENVMCNVSDIEFCVWLLHPRITFWGYASFPSSTERKRDRGQELK